MKITTRPGGIGRYELRYRSLFTAGRAFAFPCNALGEVPIDDLSASALDNYLYARAVVGLEYAFPSIELV
jgi:hypothetical protein